MKRTLLSAVATIVAVAFAFAIDCCHADELSAGDPAPPFELVGSDGKTYKLSELTGNGAVVVAWYPKAFTGG